MTMKFNRCQYVSFIQGKPQLNYIGTLNYYNVTSILAKCSKNPNTYFNCNLESTHILSCISASTRTQAVHRHSSRSGRPAIAGPTIWQQRKLPCMYKKIANMIHHFCLTNRLFTATPLQQCCVFSKVQKQAQSTGHVQTVVVVSCSLAPLISLLVPSRGFTGSVVHRHGFTGLAFWQKAFCESRLGHLQPCAWYAWVVLECSFNVGQ